MPSPLASAGHASESGTSGLTRTRLSPQVADEVRRYFPTETLATVIPRSVRVSEAPSYGQSVITYHDGSAGAVAYLRVAEEITQRAETRTA